MTIPKKRRQALIEALPGTLKELAERLQVQPATVGIWVISLCGEGGAHIGEWRKQSRQGPPVRVYHSGPGPDVPCDLPTNGRNLRMAGADFVGGRKVVRAYPKRDPITAALFGPA